MLRYSAPCLCDVRSTLTAIIIDEMNPFVCVEYAPPQVELNAVSPQCILCTPEQKFVFVDSHCCTKK